MNTLEKFVDHYIDCMIWADLSEEDGEIGYLGLSDEAMATARKDCRKFIDDNKTLVESWDYKQVERAAHDFWLTRNGHGAGFWDGDWPEHGDALTDYISKNFDEQYLYAGDDNRLYLA